MPPAARSRVEPASALVLPRVRVPAESVVVPEKVLAPERVRLPRPDLERPPVPESAPEMRLLPSPARESRRPPLAMSPETVRVLPSAMVQVWAPVKRRRAATLASPSAVIPELRLRVWIGLDEAARVKPSTAKVSVVAESEAPSVTVAGTAFGSRGSPVKVAPPKSSISQTAVSPPRSSSIHVVDSRSQVPEPPGTKPSADQVRSIADDFEAKPKAAAAAKKTARSAWGRRSIERTSGVSWQVG